MLELRLSEKKGPLLRLKESPERPKIWDLRFVIPWTTTTHQ